MSAANVLAEGGPLPAAVPEEFVALVEQLARLKADTLTLGELGPSEEQLNEDPELEAWWAGVGPPPAQKLAPPLLAPSRTNARRRERRYAP